MDDEEQTFLSGGAISSFIDFEEMLLEELYFIVRQNKINTILND